MLPNYKRPTFRDYMYNRFEEPLDDQDLDMIDYLEEIEIENKMLKKRWRKLFAYCIDMSSRSWDTNIGTCYDDVLEEMEFLQEAIKYER